MRNGFRLSGFISRILLLTLVIGYGGFFVPTYTVPVAQAITCSNSDPAFPVSHWTGDNTTQDASDGNSGTLQNGAIYTSLGKVNQAFDFDGVDDYVSVADAANLRLTSTGTLSAWVYPLSGNPDGGGIISKRNTDALGGIEYSMYYIGSTNKVELNISDGSSSQTMDSVTSVPINTWTHVTASWNSGTWKIYINGTLDVSQTGHINALSSNDTVRIGSRNASGPTQYFKGRIDEPRIFNEPISDATVKAMYISESGGCSSITNASDTLTANTYGAASNHTVTFTTPGGVEAGQSVTLYFPASFTIPGALDYTDVDLSASTGGNRTLAASPSGTTWGVTHSGQTIRLLSDTGTIAPGDTITIKIGTNAVVGTTGDQQITNASTPGGYTLEVGSTFGEVGNIPLSVSGPNCVSAPSGLVSWWGANDNTSDYQSNNTGSLKNGATFGVGKSGDAFDLDGSNDYIRVADNANLQLDSFTVAAWVRPETAGVSSIVQKGGLDGSETDNNNNYRLGIDGTGHPFGRTGTGASFVDITDSTALPLNTFSHLAFTSDTSLLKLYVDGASAASPVASITPIKPTSDLAIGQYTYQNTSFGNFDGQIDEVLIFNRALSPSEIHLLYTAGPSSICKPSNSLSGIKDTLSREKMGVAADHTIQFTTPTGIPEDSNVSITLPVDFDMSAITEDDIDVLDDGSDLTTASSCSGSEQAGVAIVDNTITISICAGDGGAIAKNSVVTVKIGTNATHSGTGSNQIINPASVGSYTGTIAGTFGDVGSFATPIADTDSVNASAIVPPSITFDIDTGTSVGETVPPYTVGLGTLSPTSITSSDNSTINSIYLDLDTNALGGAVVTVQGDNGGLHSNTVGSTVTTSDSGSAVGLTTGVEGFGLCVTTVSAVDGTITKSAPYNGSCNASTHNVGGITTSPRSLITSNGAPVDGTTNDSAEVMVKASISTTTKAAVDYSETLTFIATAIY